MSWMPSIFIEYFFLEINLHAKFSPVLLSLANNTVDDAPDPNTVFVIKYLSFRFLLKQFSIYAMNLLIYIYQHIYIFYIMMKFQIFKKSIFCQPHSKIFSL